MILSGMTYDIINSLTSHDDSLVSIFQEILNHIGIFFNKIWSLLNLLAPGKFEWNFR